MGDVGLHPPDVPCAVPKPRSRFRPVGHPGSHFQSRCTAHHRHGTIGFQLQQGSLYSAQRHRGQSRRSCLMSSKIQREAIDSMRCISNPIKRGPVQLFTVLFLFAAKAAAQVSQSSTSLTNIFAPETTPAKSILEVSIFVLWITGIIFVVVGGLLAYSIVKFRATPENAGREPAQIYGSVQIGMAWTVIPVLIVVVLFIATARVIHAVQDAPKPANALEVTVIGHQFWWEYRYPGLGIVT